MPWTRREAKRSENRLLWIAAGIGSVLLGVLAGYAMWGQSAAIVHNVEHHLAVAERKVKNLEDRITTLEARITSGGSETKAEGASARAY